MTDDVSDSYQYSSLGGRLCLNFANTVNGWQRPQGEPLGEFIPDYAALVEWGRQLGALTDAEAHALLAAAAAQPAAAEATLGLARELRAALYRLFLASSLGQAASTADLAVVNREVALGLSHTRLAQTEDGFAAAWEKDATALDRPLWPVARSAVEVLTSDDVARVHACGGEGCGWLFVDTSKNHSRRWCSMAECGNRAKARRHYKKGRGAG